MIIACSYYFTNYILKQKFQLFCNYKITQETVTQTDIIDNSTSFNWISCLNNNPKKEVENIKISLNLESKENKDDQRNYEMNLTSGNRNFLKILSISVIIFFIIYWILRIINN